ncbi:cytidylyltransferase domain-containing protein [Altererythrobacter rubellus]|uniref:Acylneuraminate cytidylyltransferase family protein n=1 Tax=Altererythrobacter rubellus TaxID=2173831 RepID=A0A9Y2F6K3_9SPHN|nr:acylneuraminate cytidylyltransferase family protein [Altererythrobacter rubellus]WIW95937.1 acylneuraminate cytidylyltransferase family protein [Altererythrobacter rubellus]
MKARVAALITARGGSKGLPGKNIRLLGGKPLLAHSIEVALQSSMVDAVYLSTDSREIADLARAHGCEVPFLRAAELATDEATSIDVVCDALDRLPPYEIWLLLQPTSPLRTAEDLDGVVTMMERTGAYSCVSVTEAQDHPWLTFAIGDDGAMTRFCSDDPIHMARRQDMPRAFVLNGAVYGFRPDWLRRGRVFVDAKSLAWVMPAERSVDIDDLCDFERAEALWLTVHGCD